MPFTEEERASIEADLNSPVYFDRVGEAVEEAEAFKDALRRAKVGAVVPYPVGLDRRVTDHCVKMVNAEREAAAALPKRLIDTDSATRKKYPMAAGLLDYFPDALAEVAKVSYIGNEKHNPGEPMHHARGKSMDHADCIVRHLVGRGGFDGDLRESAALAWRALALLQEELEREQGLSLPRGARAAE